MRPQTCCQKNLCTKHPHPQSLLHLFATQSFHMKATETSAHSLDQSAYRQVPFPLPFFFVFGTVSMEVMSLHPGQPQTGLPPSIARFFCLFVNKSLFVGWMVHCYLRNHCAELTRMKDRHKMHAHGSATIIWLYFPPFSENMSTCSFFLCMHM